MTNLKLAEPESRSLFGMLHDFVTRKPIDLPFCLVDPSLSSIYSILFHWYTTSLASSSKAKAVIPEYTQNSNGQEEEAYKSGCWLLHCQHVFCADSRDMQQLSMHGWAENFHNQDPSMFELKLYSCNRTPYQLSIMGRIDIITDASSGLTKPLHFPW